MFRKIYIEITNVCNLKCKFCPDTNRKKEYMDLEKFEEIIKKVHNHTNLVCLHVKGEPLLHKQLEQILAIIEKYNLKTNITTNGTLILEKLDILKKSKAVRQINFSIHSINQNNNLTEQYLNNIFQSVAQLPHIIISYRLWNKGNNFNIAKIIEEYYNINNLNEKLIQNSFVKLKDNIFINTDSEFVWPNINATPIIEKGKCLALKEQIAILVDGTVVPCCLDNNGDILLGNIFSETLEEILNNSKSLSIKNNFDKGIITCKLCRTCGFLQRLENKRKNK